MAAPPLKIEAARETARIIGFITRTVGEAGAKGVVLGLSGGIDSAVVGALCLKALGKGRVFALLMPTEHTPKQDIEDAQKLAEYWGIGSAKIPISEIVSGLTGAAKIAGSKMAGANAQARVRMALLYYYANTMGYLVAGTGDRSESEIGFYTKFGDGGVDFLPIVHLYKTQVRQLGTHLGLPKSIVEKPASPQLWPGHTAAQELPADYDKLDVVLSCLLDEKLSPAQAASRAGVLRGVVERVLEMHRKTAHKRAMPPSLLGPDSKH
jgi:NAD+ synthase